MATAPLAFALVACGETTAPEASAACPPGYVCFASDAAVDASPDATSGVTVSGSQDDAGEGGSGPCPAGYVCIPEDASVSSGSDASSTETTDATSTSDAGEDSSLSTGTGEDSGTADAMADAGVTEEDATVGAQADAGADSAPDGGAVDGEATDGEPADALPDAPPYDTGPGWQPDDAGVSGETYDASGDGGPAVTCIDLPTADLVADPTTPLLYASVTSTSPELGNSVVRIDPATLTVTGTVFVGSNPDALAITDDGTVLYLGEDGAGSVRRVDLGSGAVEAPVYLGVSEFSGLRVAGEIRAVPGSDTRYVVSRRVLDLDPSFAGLALYDGATLLGEWDSFVGGESLAFVSPTVLYGYNNEDTGYDLFRLDVTSSGFQQVSDVEGILTGFATQITSQGGWIFATSGQTVDGANGQAVGDYSASGSVWPDTNGADVWFLESTDEGSTPALLDFNRSTFLLKRSFPLPDALLGSGTPATLVGLSSGRFAFRTPYDVCVLSVGK